jgi:putative aldouronate transport system substrate-binding protein
MKMFSKKTLAVVIAGLLSVGILAGCGDKTKKEPTTPTGQNGEPAKPVDVSIWTWLGMVEVWGGKSYDEVLAFQELPKKTNTNIQWIHPTGSAVEAFNLMMTSGETTDLIWYAWSTARCVQFYKAGRILDIAPIVKEHAPNLMKLINTNPQLKKQLFDPQGRMYYMPWITMDKSLLMREGMMLRKDWLDKVNMPVPTTPDELYNTLKAFREQDANGNGKQDEVGLTGYPGQIYKLFYAFGTADDWHLNNGQVEYGPATHNYKEGLKFLAKLYKDGLLDKDFLVNDGDIYVQKNVNGLAAGYIDNPESFGRVIKLASEKGTPINYVPVPYLKHNGVSVALNAATKRVAQPYGLAVSSKAKDKAVDLIKFLDWHYSEDGQRLLNWGIDNDTFTLKDGKPVYTDKVMKDSKEIPGVAQSKYVNPSWVGIQDLRATEAISDELGLAAVKAWSAADNKNAMEPILWMTDEESNTLKQYTTDLATFKNEWRDKFITGKEDVDAKFDWFVEQLNKMGLAEAKKAQQSAYERFIK